MSVKKNIIVILAVTALAVAGCKSKSGTDVPENTKVIDIPAGTGKKGKITKTMNQGGYTYIEVADDKGGQTWLALPEMKVAEGDRIEYQETQPMVNFTSKTLKKTFEKIYFVPGVRIEK